MANVDPNTYALQVSLAMDTMQAEASLDQFGESLTAVEDQISSSATKAFGSIEKTLGSINEGLADISKYASMSISDMEDEVKKLQLRDKILGEAEDFADNEAKALKDHQKNLENIIEQIETKNLLHEDENDLVEHEIGLHEQLADEAGRHRDNVRATDEIFRNMIRNIERIISLTIASDQLAEQFVTTNWRAYGSQQKLAQEVRETAMQYGVLRSEAEAAMVVMGTMKVPRDELNAYTKSVAEASRYTGMSTQSIGEYGHRLRATGIGVDEFEKHMHKLSATMRNTKLSTQDLQNVLNGIDMSPAGFEMIYGDKAYTKFNEFNAALAGIASQAGLTSEQFAAFLPILTDFDRLIMFESASGIDIQGPEDFAKALRIVGEEYNQLKKENEEYARVHGRQSAALLNEMEALEDISGLMRGQGGELARLAEYMGDNNIMLETQADLMAYNTSLADPQSKANQTLTRQWEMMTDKLATLVQYGLEPLRYALMRILTYVNVMLIWINKAVIAFGKFWAMLEGIPILGELFKYIKFVAGAMLLLIAAGIGLVSVFTGLAISFGGVVGVFRGALVFIRLFTTAMIQLATAVGRSIVILLTSIGQGLANLGRAIQPVMLPLLALGAALLMAGLGAYFFAQSVLSIMQLPWQQAVGGLLLMIVAIGLLGLVLIGLAYIAAPVAPILLALGLTFLMIGAAAWLMGAGLLMAAQSLKYIAEYGSQISIATWFKLAAGIALVGAAGLIAGPGLILAGLGLMMLGTAAILVAKALTIVIEAMKKFGTEVIVDIGKAVRQAAWYFVEAGLALALIGPVLLLAAASIMVGSLALIAAVPLLLTASLLLVAAGAAMIVGAIFFGIGAGAMLAAGAVMAVAGLLALIGGSMLFAAAAMILPAAVAISFSAVLLLPAAIAMIIGAGFLVFAAVAIGIAGAALILGGAILRVAAWLWEGVGEDILEAGLSVMKGGRSLQVGANALLEGAASLDAAMDMLNDIDTTGLEKLAEMDELEFSGEPLRKLGSTLVSVAEDLGDSTAKFKRPADELAAVLENLGDAIVGFGSVGSQLEEDLDNLIATLDTYVDQLDAVAERIETAVEMKALPAVRAAEQAGIQEAIRSEAVTTVEVMPGSPAEDRQQTRMVGLIEEQNTILMAVVEVLENLGGGEEVTRIRELLEDQDFAASEPPSNRLRSDLNRWS